MVSFTRRSILKQLALAVAALAVFPILAWAQHAGVPAHPPVAPVHVYAPPVYRAPVIPTPVVRPPVFYAPPRYGVVPSAATFRPGIIPLPVRPIPIHPIRRPPPLLLVYSPLYLFGDPFWRFNQCWWGSCDLYWPWTLGYTTVYSPGPTNYVLQASETPVYVYGYEREDTPELDLKDSTVLNVTDYWVVDNQLHFKIIEETGAKPVEHSVPFEELDLQKTVDANTRRGFRFLLRNEPFEEYVRDHPEGPPPVVVPPQQ